MSSFFLDQAGDKLKREKQKADANKRRALARKRKVEQKAKDAHAEAAQQMEVARARREEEARAKAMREEDARQAVLARTGGVTYSTTFKAAPWATGADSAGSDGDRVTLPPDALQALNGERVLEQRGPMFFELTTREGARTHAGVHSFVAAPGMMGLPDKVAQCLGAVTEADNADANVWATRVKATYVRLPPGTKTVLQPLTASFHTDALLDESPRKPSGGAAAAPPEAEEGAAGGAGGVVMSVQQTLASMGFSEHGCERAVVHVREQEKDRALNDEEVIARAVAWLMNPTRTTSELEEAPSEGLVAVLEKAMKAYCCMTVGDVVHVRHRGNEYHLVVKALEPADQVSLIDTELEVEIAASCENEELVAREEARLQALEDARRRKEEEERLQREQEEAARAAEQARAREAAEAAQRVVDEARAALPAKEPAADAEGAMTCMFRLPDGGRVTRRVLRSDGVRVLFLCVDAQGAQDGEYVLATARPRHVVRRGQPESIAEALQLPEGERNVAFFVEAC